MYPDIPIWLACIFTAGGLWLLKVSAEIFIDGSAATAARLGISPFVTGMVVVGFGTSAPELCVSALSGIGGKSDLSLGNAYGSCICNIALILGVAALIRPLRVSRTVRFFAVPALVAISVLSCCLVSLGNGFSRSDAFVCIGVFAVLLPLYCKFNSSSRAPAPGEGKDPAAKTISAAKGVAMLLGGLVLLAGSSHILVWGAVDLALAMGVSELLVGLTILAVGTSLPELASAIVSARRGEDDMVLGNIIGSNLFNTLAVVGVAGAISPFSKISPYILSRDMPAMIALSVSIALFALRKGRAGRLAGAIWLISYAVYVAAMIMQETP